MKCVLCDGGDFLRESYLARVVALDDEGVFRCTQCGLIRRGRLRGSRACSPEYFDRLSAHFPTSDDLEASFCERRLRDIASRVETGRLLEIGPGAGRFAELARSNGWEVFAIEADQENAESLRASGIEVLEGEFDRELPENLLDSGLFDVVYANHVLEHTENPVRFVENSRRALRKDGLLLIEVPNEVSSTVATLRSFLRMLPAAGAPIPTEHNFFFRPGVLRRVVEEAGFSDVSVSTRENERTLARQSGVMKTYRRIDGWLGKGSLIEVMATATTSDSTLP